MNTTKNLYIGLENPWPENIEFGNFVKGIDYTRIGSTIYIHRNVTPGIYVIGPDTYQFLCHYRIPAHKSKRILMNAYPDIKSWLDTKWPIPVGRYYYDLYVIDVIFSTTPEDGDNRYSETRQCLINPAWNANQKKEWLTGSYGYWTDWTYDLKTSAIANIAMTILNSLPSHQRTPQKVVRKIISMANEANSSEGLLYGMWDPKRFSEGYEPSYWKSSYQILNYREKTGKPVKFAQCWIFSEVLVSIFRYIGIPSRTIFVENARIDRGNDGGVDIGIVMSKGDDGKQLAVEDLNYNPLTQLLDGIDQLGDFENEYCTKGDDELEPLLEPEYTTAFKPDGEAEIDLRKYVSSDDSIWNFHVFPEVYIQKPNKEYEWHCLDGCPAAVTTSTDEFAGQKTLGPCPVSSIKNNTPTAHDHEYFSSTINALYRYWRTQQITLSDGKKIDVTYPHNINYGALVGSNDRRQIRITIRDPDASMGPRNVVKLNITNTYKLSTDLAFELHHKYHPLIFIYNQTLSYKVQHSITTQHYFQLCFLDDKGYILKCHRRLIDTLNHLYIPAIPTGTAKISITLVNLTSLKWWVQVV